MFKEIIDRLLAFPQRGEVKIDFDLKKKIFSLSVPIFAARPSLPSCIQQYVEARKESVFQPHVTSFQIEGNKVLLKQDIPFASDFQSTLRNQVDQFWQMSRHCHKMLAEIAIEDKYSAALKFEW